MNLRRFPEIAGTTCEYRCSIDLACRHLDMSQIKKPGLPMLFIPPFHFSCLEKTEHLYRIVA